MEHQMPDTGRGKLGAGRMYVTIFYSLRYFLPIGRMDAKSSSLMRVPQKIE